MLHQSPPKREVRRDSDVASMQDANLDSIHSIEKYLFMQQRYDISSERQIISVFLCHYKIIAHSHWLDSKR